MGIIIDFSIGIGWDKLDYQYYKVDIFLKKNDKIDSIIKYVEKNPYLACINHTLGYADLELEFVLRNLYQLNQIIDDISNKFPDSIRNYSYFCALKFHERQKFPIFLR